MINQKNKQRQRETEIIANIISFIFIITILILNIFFNDIIWLKFTFAILGGFVNGYCLFNVIKLIKKHKREKELLNKALKTFLHYVEWQNSHTDLNIEDYLKYYGDK